MLDEMKGDDDPNTMIEYLSCIVNHLFFIRMAVDTTKKKKK